MMRFLNVQISSAADVQHVLATNFDNYVHSPHFQASFGRVFARSFLAINHAHTADNGALWRLERKVAMKVLTTSNFKDFSESIFSKYAAKMVEIIQQNNGTCNMYDISTMYTLQAIFDISCGLPLHEVDDKLGLTFIGSFNYIAKQGVYRLFIAPYFQSFWWLMPSEYKMLYYERDIFKTVHRMLDRRLQESPEEIAPRADIMSLFIKRARELEAAREGGASILDRETLSSVFLTLIFAGWETTASALTHTFYMLAKHPEVQQKAYEEVMALNKTAFNFDDAKQLKYLDAVVHETLRLYPSAVFGSKMCCEDDHLPDGTFVPAGTEVTWSMWYMGRNNQALWGEDEKVFRPERWLEMEKRPTAFDFPVFQAGPRVCIGMNMSLLESKIFTATMLRHFHVKIQDGEATERHYGFSTTLEMQGGLPLQMSLRSGTA